MATDTQTYVTPDEYLAREREAEQKHEYVLVDQATTHVEHFVRQPEGGWLLFETDARADAISLAAIDCELPLSEMYHKAEAASRDESWGDLVHPKPPTDEE